MPAASSEKKARQRANKLVRKETEATTVSDAPPPVHTAGIASESPFTPTPTFFTISYSPLSISHPEPVDPAARLLSDAVRVTRNELAMMLRQSYIHGTEHGWKANMETARERLQAEYEKDMEEGTAKFAEHEKQIRTEEFTRGFDEARIQFKAQLELITEDLNTQHEEKVQHALADIFERQQEWRDEEYVQAFALGRTTGIQDEHEYQESARASQSSVATQTDPITTSSTSVQTNSPITPLSFSASISTQTEPTISESTPILIPISISEPPIPATISSSTFNWADDAISLPIIPTIPPKMPRDLSSLRSSTKNPFSSLHRRHHYPKRQQNFSSHRYNQSRPPPHHTPPLLNHPLEWHRDPRLFELSRVLRTLGWSHP
jgi:hypothetical protein